VTQKNEGRRTKGVFATVGALLLVGASGGSPRFDGALAWGQSPNRQVVVPAAGEEASDKGQSSSAGASEPKAPALGKSASSGGSDPKGTAQRQSGSTGSYQLRAAEYATAPSGVQHSVAFLTVVLAQEEAETFQALSREKMDAFVKAVTAAADSNLNGHDKFDTKQLIVRCLIKEDGTDSFVLTTKPGLSGPLTAGLDQALRAIPVPVVKDAVSMEIIFAVGDRQTQIAAQARHLTRAGKAGEAAELLAPVATDDCGNAFVWQQLGWAYSAKGDFPKAEKTLQRAIQLDPRDFDSWANLVSTYHSEGKVKEAEYAAKKNLDCAPNEESTDVVNINSALYSGDWATAESILRRLCKRTGDYGAAYQVILAYALRWQGKNDEAKELLETALHQQNVLKQDLDDYYAKLAEKQLALLKGDWKTAEELGRQDLSKDPKDYESLYDMGLALKGEGKLDEARKAFEAAVQPVTPKSVLKAVNLQMKELSSATTNSATNSTAKQAEN
jgi:tetratricopeptide (TPR) repeat protein